MDSLKGRFHAPCVMLGSLSGAFLFAIGHHLFYHSLDGTVVSSAPFTQNINTAAGTAFAFLVRALMVVALVSAYSQILWRTFLQRSLAVSTIDNLSALLTSVWELLDRRRAWRHPVLLVLAYLTWTTSLATILPPATLSVHSSLFTIHDMKPVTSVDWKRWKMYSSLRIGHSRSASYNNWLWNVFATQTSRTAFNLATIVALQGYVPDMPFLQSNTSYDLDFTAPALQCSNVEPSIFGDHAYYCWQNQFRYREKRRFRFNVMRYISWISQVDSVFDRVPEQIAGPNNTIDCNLIESYTGKSEYNYPITAPKLLVAMLIPHSTTLEQTGGVVDVPGGPLQTWRLIECQLHEASYKVNFRSTNGQQHLTVLSKRLNAIEGTRKRLLEYFFRDDYSADNMNYLSYLTMMNLIAQIVVGRITMSDAYEGLYYKSPDILNTRLIYTSEFIELFSPHWVGNYGSLPYVDGKAPKADESIGSLASGLEQLFENLTFSMFSYPPMTSTTERVVNVSSWAPQNVYVYSQEHLTASYGSGLLVTAMVVAYGCFIVAKNEASYQTRFSTFLRTIRWQEVENLSDHTRPGADPLPKAIADIKVQIGRLNATTKASEPEDPEGATM